MIRLILVLLVAFAAAAPESGQAWRNYPRDPEVPREFQRQSPCPSTGRTYGGCPGYIRDHIIPLCANGPDSPSNMQWQRLDDSLRKDEEERAACRRMHQLRGVQWDSIHPPPPRLYRNYPSNNPRTDH
jgi:hypothetical protein